MLLPIFSKERKILPYVVSKEIRVFVGLVKAPVGSKMGIDKESTFLERDLQWILLNSLCLQGVQSMLILSLCKFS